MSTQHSNPNKNKELPIFVKWLEFLKQKKEGFAVQNFMIELCIMLL